MTNADWIKKATTRPTRCLVCGDPSIEKVRGLLRDIKEAGVRIPLSVTYTRLCETNPGLSGRFAYTTFWKHVRDHESK